MKSIYSKLVLGFLASILFSFSVAGYFSVKKNSQVVGEQTIEELHKCADQVAEYINLLDEEDLARIMKGYAETSDISISILSSDSKQVYGKNAYSILLQSQDNQVVESKSLDNSLRKVAKSYLINNQFYTIYIQKDITQREMTFMESGLIALFCALFVGSVTFLIIADVIVKPIYRLIRATNELSKGNYKVRVNYSGDDEIARLNRSFNTMAQQLAKQEVVRQQFISDVSHEFQTPLTAIQGFAAILKNEKLTDEQRVKYADIILFHSKRLSTLSKNMLQLTLLEGEDVKLEITEFSLCNQLSRVIETQDNLALSKNIEIEIKLPKNDVIIEGDESRLEQVWINLINNAIKYTPENGNVIVSVKKFAKEVEVRIKDTGVGMSKETISHIFERFYRVDKSRRIEGNGLGLSIVKRLIDLHNWNIDIISAENEGSEFIVRIPQSHIFQISDIISKDDISRKGKD